MTGLDSTETTTVSLGSVSSEAARRAPNRPTSSALVKTAYRSVSASSSTSRSTEASMAAQPARSSRARIRIVPPSSSKPGRSKTTGVDGAIHAGCRGWIVTSRSLDPSGVGPSNGRVSAWTGSLPSGRTSTGVGLVREAAGTPPSARATTPSPAASMVSNPGWSIWATKAMGRRPASALFA